MCRKMRSHRLWTKKQRMPLLTISKVNMFWNCLNFAVSLLFFYTCTWIKYHCCRCSRRAGLLCFAEEWAVGSRNRKDPRSPDGGQTSAVVPAREEESLLCMSQILSVIHVCALIRPLFALMMHVCFSVLAQHQKLVIRRRHQRLSLLVITRQQ